MKTKTVTLVRKTAKSSDSSATCGACDLATTDGACGDVRKRMNDAKDPFHCGRRSYWKLVTE